MIVSTSGGNAPIAAWRSRAKLRFPPRQLCRSCLPTEDTRVKVLDQQRQRLEQETQLSGCWPTWTTTTRLRTSLGLREAPTAATSS